MAAQGTPYALYRASGVGSAFVESMNELFGEQEINQDQYIQAMLAFDKVVNDQLANREPANKLTVSGQLAHYRFCDSVWTLVLKDARLDGDQGSIESKQIKIVACEARNKGKRGSKK